MSKTNYSAWHINSDDFSEDWSETRKLLFFAKYAILAPSGHNTQPWRFKTGKNGLLLSADFSRRLPYSGIQANEPYVSLGACIGTLELAAQGFGYNIIIDYTLSEDVVACITLSTKSHADPSLLKAIVRRVSNRNYYETANLPKKLLKDFLRTTLNNISSYLISDRDDISFIAEQTVHATHTTMGDKEFRAELSKWVRNNVTRRHDGMPGFVQGIPTPVSLLARHIIKRVDVSKDQARKDSKRILHSANLVVISVDDSSHAALLNAGRLYSKVCILAEHNKIASTGLGAAIIDPATREEIVKKFKLSGKPIAIIRLGYTNKRAKHTPRWPLTKVMS